MTAADLTETEVSSQTVFHGNLLHVKRDQVKLPSGHESGREYVIHPGAVLVIPVLENGNLVFERQFRYPLRQTFIEFPAGKIDPSEPPLITGQRELLEETGYTASKWRLLAALHPCIGYSTEIIHIYIATGLQAGEHRREVDESLEVFSMTIQQAMVAMQQGDITDGKTMVALFWAEKLLSGDWQTHGHTKQDNYP